VPLSFQLPTTTALREDAKDNKQAPQPPQNKSRKRPVGGLRAGKRAV
jgi:hypothetical protein